MQIVLGQIAIGLLLGFATGVLLGILDDIIESRNNMILVAVLVGISLVYVTNLLDYIIFGVK